MPMQGNMIRSRWIATMDEINGKPSARLKDQLLNCWDDSVTYVCDLLYDSKHRHEPEIKTRLQMTKFLRCNGAKRKCKRIY
jgi:hypothetical protein